MKLHPSPQDVFFSRNDLEDPRLGDLVSAQTFAHALQDTSVAIVLLGHADDEGIRLNGGRPGAHLAPQSIRQFLYRMTPSVFSDSPYCGIADVGDLTTEQGTQSEKHEFARTNARSLFRSGKFLAALGGGHDYGYADVSGFLDVYGGQNPLVINIDAHLDVRPVVNGKLHSGTPFYRVLTEFKGSFEFIEFGIQAQCNSKSHLRWAEAQGARIVPVQGAADFSLIKTTVHSPERPAFLSLDIDGFANGLAPGCSQSWNQGLSLTTVFNLIDTLQMHFSLKGVGIYEVSPPLDVADRTSKLAAEVLHHIFYGRPQK